MSVTPAVKPRLLKVAFKKVTFTVLRNRVTKQNAKLDTNISHDTSAARVIRRYRIGDRFSCQLIDTITAGKILLQTSSTRVGQQRRKNLAERV